LFAHRCRWRRKACGHPAQKRGIITPPPAPTQVQATRQSNGLVRINWDAVDDAARYQIWRSPLAGGGYQLVTTTTTNSFVDNPRRFDAEYHYTIKTIDRSHNVSVNSADATAITR